MWAVLSRFSNDNDINCEKGSVQVFDWKEAAYNGQKDYRFESKVCYDHDVKMYNIDRPFHR